MAESTQILIFKILLTDPARVATLQGTGDAQGAILAAPDAAAITYAAPLLAAHAPVVAPCIVSTWFGGDFPTNVPSFDRKSGGWFGWSWLFGNTTHYKWRGLFVYSPPLQPTGPNAPPVILSRRFIDGFELPSFGESGAGTITEYARVASRHVQGYGMALRSSTGVKTHIPSENIGGALPATSWERFYVRLRSLPASGGTTFWTANGTVSPSEGVVLQITPTGQIAAYISNNVGVLALLGTTAIQTLHTWIKLDVLVRFGVDAVRPNLQLLVNGVTALTATDNTAGLSTINRLHASSTMGAGAANTLGLDIDDWMQADYPSAAQLAQGVDVLNGSAIVPVTATALDPSSAGWTGDFRTLLQNPVVGALTTLTSAAGASRLTVTTDAKDTVDAIPGSLGMVALQVAFNGTVTAGHTLGYKIGAAAEVLAAPNAPGLAWFTVLWRLVGALVAQKPNDPITFTHLSGAAGAVTAIALAGVAEVIGVFGPEDLPVGALVATAPVGNLGPHNAPYPRTPWAELTTPPIQPVTVVQGTYTGNGTAQDLVFSSPIHFLWIRPVTGGGGGTRWWSSLLGAHRANLQSPVAHLMPQATVDVGFVAGVGPTPASGDRTDMVRSVKNALVAAGTPTLVGDCGAFEITKRVAWALRAEGVGLQSKPAGANCQGYAPGILMWADGTIHDILGDAGGANTPQWLTPAPISATLYRAAINPGDEATGGGSNTAQLQVRLRLVGTDVDSNANGVVYSYLAVGDPGMRYLLNGGLTNWKGAADRITTLVHGKFTPLAGFVWPEVIGTTATSTLLYKGPGHAAASISPVGGAAQLANRLTFGLGQVTSQAAFNADYATYAQASVSLWRTDDTSGHPGAVVQLTSYAGDGTASRDIALTPASGKRPLWVLIVPHDASAAVLRDAAHTGTTSTQLPATLNAATGITGGAVDSITVSSVINTAGIVYDVFAIPGGVDACNGGFSCPGTFEPVPPEPPPDAPGLPLPLPIPGPAPFPSPPTTPPIDPLPPTGPMPGITDDLDPACAPDTHRIVNVALSRLGVATQVVNLATDLTAEATIARLEYVDAVQQTLRDFPWPFATRYVRLIPVSDPLVAINSDWLYSYRQPSDCLFERRLVVPRGPALDPTPPPFQLSNDDTGGLLFTNQPNAVLEYTARPKCPHTRSEPLFRDAVAWRLAVAMAPALTRMTDMAVAAQKMYWETIALARQVLRPGNPGALPAAATVDISAAAQRANLIVVNRALLRVGANTIASLSTDQSEESQAAQLIFEDELRATLRDFPWAFATTYADPLVLVAGTAAVPVNKDWTYSYRLPTDLVFARRLVSPSGRLAEGTVQMGGFLQGSTWPTYPVGQATPPTFRLGQDATGGLLFTNQLTPALEYTRRPEGAVLMADALFRDALAWRLAAMLAPSLAQIHPEQPDQIGRGPQLDPPEHKEVRATGVQLRQKIAERAWQQYRLALVKASTADANEQQQEPDGNADWITGRQ